MNPEKKKWRFLPYSIHDAASNMAIDEAILDAHLAGKVPPTLRVYGWKPPAVSIGYGQKLSDVVAERIKSKGFDIVRRPTGGRAVLHAHELTYSFVGSSDAGCSNGDDEAVFATESVLSTGVLSAYKQICQGLLSAFQELGLELSLGASNSAYKNQSDCFLATTSADLHYNGDKVVGSAQLRRHHAVLQHGSILLDQPQDLMHSLLAESKLPESESSNTESSKSESPKRHANLFEILDRDVSISVLQTALKAGFEDVFQCELDPTDLSEFEEDLVAQYCPRYQTPLHA